MHSLLYFFFCCSSFLVKWTDVQNYCLQFTTVKLDWQVLRGGEKQIEMQIKHDAFDFPWMSWFLKKISREFLRRILSGVVAAKLAASRATDFCKWLFHNNTFLKILSERVCVSCNFLCNARNGNHHMQSLERERLVSRSIIGRWW